MMWVPVSGDLIGPGDMYRHADNGRMYWLCVWVDSLEIHCLPMSEDWTYVSWTRRTAADLEVWKGEGLPRA